MKLKQAAKSMLQTLDVGIYYLAAERDGKLYIFNKEPRALRCGIWWTSCRGKISVGQRYTGNKSWDVALIKFEVSV